MRWMVFATWTALLTGTTAFAQSATSTPKKPTPPPTHLPSPTAEPDNGQTYAPPVPYEREGPSDADVGPVLKHFVRASTTDDLETTQNADNASLAIHEKIALDKKITVPLIHDVQNDGPATGSGIHSMAFEIKYINWGAVTEEQLLARRGHYFTITWDNDGPKGDFTSRFEYRQVKSKEIVRTLTQTATNVSGSTRSYFAVCDKAYLSYGPVYSWRFTVLRGDTVVAEAKSFVW